MPYPVGDHLAGERASKLGHLDVIKSPLIQKLIHDYEKPEINDSKEIDWQDLPMQGKPLDIVFAVDGSMQIIRDEYPPHSEMSFVKTALLRMDDYEIAKIDKETPHPFQIRDLMAESAIYHATVFPLRYLKSKTASLYDAVRYSIFDSLHDTLLDGEPYETLKWIVYHKWSGNTSRKLPGFQCPHCGFNQATLEYDEDKGKCQDCGKELLLTDMLGFHLEMVEGAARDSVAIAYMNIHETLLLFTGIRLFWENKKEVLKRCLFIKDGPLQIRAQYSKLVAPIRLFLQQTASTGYPVCILGQEKTGFFKDHLDFIVQNGQSDCFFIPSHKYICEKIQFRPTTGAPYGKDTNYGAKIFLLINNRYKLVLNIPILDQMELFIHNPTATSLIGFDRIIATLPNILSSRYENALLPVELANSVASLSTYPSAQILKIFAERNMN
jgi:hypothetical protein